MVYYSGNTGQEHPAETRIWSPATGGVRTPPNVPQTDLFCSGLALTFDGRLFVAGGTTQYPADQNSPWIGSKAA